MTASPAPRVIDGALASPVAERRHVRQARSSGVSIRAGLGTGALVGLSIGLLFGGILGALLVWLAAAVLEWQRSLGFTLGLARTLLPFGDQVATLRWMSDNWPIVVPAAAGIIGAVTAVLAALVGGLVVAAYRVATHRGPTRTAGRDLDEAPAEDEQ